MIDIDHFKAINDRYGHGGGDVVLVHAARLIATSVRLSDLPGRYGGEEFCIVLPGCTPTEAGRLAEHLVDLARQQQVRLGDGCTACFTISAGYAECQTDQAQAGETLSQVIDRADQALYKAKNSGRNQAQPGL